MKQSLPRVPLEQNEFSAWLVLHDGDGPLGEHCFICGVRSSEIAAEQAVIYFEDHEKRTQGLCDSDFDHNRMDDGVPKGFYEGRVGCLGNAVFPQVAEWIGRQIMNHVGDANK